MVKILKTTTNLNINGDMSLSKIKTKNTLKKYYKLIIDNTTTYYIKPEHYERFLKRLQDRNHNVLPKKMFLKLDEYHT